jgi:hypothetical protein
MDEPVTTYPAASPAEAELAHRNIVFGWALFGLFCLLFAGTIGVAYIYLWLS